MKPEVPSAAPGKAPETIAADIARKSANPGEPYGNARPGQHANDTLGPKGYQPPGGPVRVMVDQQQTQQELARLNPGPQYDAHAEARAKAAAKAESDEKGGKKDGEGPDGPKA